MNDKILIFGKGYIGERVREEFGCRLSEKRISSFKSAEDEVDRFSPKVIINCAGHIGRNVDDCEMDKDKTLASNAFLPIVLGEVALRRKINFVHISSGCIYRFDFVKDKPISEEKTPDFFELFYSRTKIYSEQALKILSAKYPFLVIRIRLPLDDRPHPRNILTKLIKSKKVIDIPNSVTYMPDFLSALRYLMKVRARGIYNVVAKGPLRYPELLEAYREYNPDFEYRTINPNKLGLLRTNLVLSTKKLEKSGFKVRTAKEAVEECLKRYVKY